MNLQIEKLDEDLVLPIPPEWVRTLGLLEGATVAAEISPDGVLLVRTAKGTRRALADEIARTYRSIQMSPSVVDKERGKAPD